MLDRVDRVACLPAWGTQLGEIAFYHVHVSSLCQAIPASQGEINLEKMAAHGEFFLVTICQCYLPNKMTISQKRSMYM